MGQRANTDRWRIVETHRLVTMASKAREKAYLSLVGDVGADTGGTSSSGTLSERAKVIGFASSKPGDISSLGQSRRSTNIQPVRVQSRSDVSLLSVSDDSIGPAASVVCAIGGSTLTALAARPKA